MTIQTTLDTGRSVRLETPQLVSVQATLKSILEAWKPKGRVQ